MGKCHKKQWGAQRNQGGIKMKRSTLFMISAMMWAVVVHSSYATDPPHDDSQTPEIWCDTCHQTHNAPAGAITNVAGNANLCQSCHVVGGQATAKALSNADQAMPAPGLPAGITPSGTSHRWDSGPSGWVTPAGSNTSPGTIQSGGAFTGRYAKTYTLTITGGGDGGVATFSWTATTPGGGSGSGTAGTDIALDEGISVTFADGGTSPSFVAGDTWQLYVRTDLNLPVDSDMAARVMDGKIMCSACHDQHSQTAGPFDPTAPTTPGLAGRHFQRIDNTINQMCVDCHSARDVAAASDGSHPVGVLIPTSSDFQSPASLPLDVDGMVACMSCHDLHFTPTNDGSLTRTADTNALCTDCHTLADTAAGVHFSGSTGVLWPGGQYGSTFPEITDTGKRGFCTNCHQPHGWPDDGTPSLDFTNLAVEQTVEVKDANNMAILDTAQNPSPPSPSDGNDLCLTCHDTQLYGGNQGRYLDAIDWTLVQHGTGQASGSSRGDLQDPYLTYSNGYSNNLTLACTDCHTPHGSGNIFLLRDSINGQPVSVTTAGYWWNICSSCHTNIGGKMHPASSGSSCSSGMGCHGTRLHKNGSSW